MTTDLQLLQRYHETGDPAAFQTLVRDHAAMVFSTARRVTGNAALAEDAAQETFLELARKGRTIRSSLAAWLHRVAWRRACDLVRAESTRKRIECTASSYEEGRESTWEELEPVFDEAMAEVPEPLRTLIVEHYLEGRTQSGIAARLGTSQSSVSRQLEQGINLLRERLIAKGVFCGTGLALVLGASTAPAAPASLIATLNKLALSKIGVTAATTVAAPAAGMIFGLSLKVAACLALLALAGVAGIELGSEQPMLSIWFSSRGEHLAEVKNRKLDHPPAVAPFSAADSNEWLLARAREIWAGAPKISDEAVQRLLDGLTEERDPDRRFVLITSTGILISREAFDRLQSRHPDVRTFDRRKAFHANLLFFRELMPVYSEESPREALALGYGGSKHFNSNLGLAYAARWIRDHPAEWSAFVQMGPDPKLDSLARLWVEELDDPGSIWGKAGAAGVSTQLLTELMFMFAESGDPDQALGFILRCPVAKARSDNMVALAPRLDDAQLVKAAASGVFEDAPLVNLLRAMAGDASVSYPGAANLVTEKAKGGGLEAEAAARHSVCINRIYSAWLRSDVKGALRHSLLSKNTAFLSGLMTEAAKAGAFDEAFVASTFTSDENRDKALAAFYQAQAGGDVSKTLERLIQSRYIVDQIEAAKPVLLDWTTRSPTGAAQWLSELPRSADHAELAAAIATKWAEAEPQAAFAFARQYGLGFDHGWQNGFAWGARNLPAASLAEMLQSVRSDPNFNLTLTRLVGYRHPSQPVEGLRMLTEHGAPGWQSCIVDDTLRWLKYDDSRALDYARALTQLDFSTVESAKIVQTAGLLMTRLASDGKMPEALDWTLKLPPNLGAQSRSEMLGRLDLGDSGQKQALQQWIRTASIPQAERDSFFRTLGR